MVPHAEGGLTMLTITGEVRKIIDDEYTNSKGVVVKQAIIVLEPDNGRQNYEVFINAKQVANGAKDQWLRAKGKKVTIPVSLFISHEYKFHKFNLINSAQLAEDK